MLTAIKHCENLWPSCALSDKAETTRKLLQSCRRRPTLRMLYPIHQSSNVRWVKWISRRKIGVPWIFLFPLCALSHKGRGTTFQVFQNVYLLHRRDWFCAHRGGRMLLRLHWLDSLIESDIWQPRAEFTPLLQDRILGVGQGLIAVAIIVDADVCSDTGLVVLASLIFWGSYSLGHLLRNAFIQWFLPWFSLFEYRLNLEIHLILPTLKSFTSSGPSASSFLEAETLR